MFQIKPLSELTLKQKIGQLIMIGIPSTSLDQETIDFIHKYQFGNYILFSRNYSDTKQLKKLMKELYTIATKVSGSFPLVSIDQEGGMVTRLFKDVTFPASPLATSATIYPDAPYVTGKIIGHDMLKLGINLNLAPCLEINKDLHNNLVNVRSYGANKMIVTQNAKQFVKGLQISGVLSCLKHFPGAGSSPKDSHLELPVITESKEEMMNEAMYPFLHILETDAIMSSHCLFKAFDEVPTTLSYNLLTTYLRDEVGYQGLIISDGMEMKAIADNYGIGQGSVMALKAGCDILLLCHEPAEQQEAIEAVYHAVENGVISEAEIDAKVERIIHAKMRLLAMLNSYCDFDCDYEVSEQEHQVMQQIVDGSYTLLKGSSPKIDGHTLVLCPSASVSSIVEDEFDERSLDKALQKAYPTLSTLSFKEEDAFKESVLKQIQQFDTIIIYAYNTSYNPVQLALINEILQIHPNVYVVSLKGPMDEVNFKNLVNYSCLYEYTLNSIKTIIKQLNGDITLQGHLPL